MATSSSGKLQDLPALSVEIRTSDHRKTVGTGVLVSVSGLVATCLHVLKDALAPGCPVAPGAEVGVRLGPREGRVREWQALACGLLDGFDDDVVLLKIQGNPVLAAEEIAVLGRAAESLGNEFLSYGFHPLGPLPATGAYGRITVPVAPPEDWRVKTRPVQLESTQLDDGMSGGAVLDKQRNLVVGLVSMIWLTDKTARNAATAWGVDGEVLGFPPFNLPIRDDALPPQPARQPRPSLTDLPVAAAPGLALQGAPPLLSEGVDRPELLAALLQDLQDPAVRVASLVGLGGSGKSTLARRWIDKVFEAAPSVAGAFWWSFNVQPSVDAFLEAALRFLSAGKLDPARLPGAGERVQVIAAMLGSGRTVFVLDGLESVQQGSGDFPGSVRSSALRTLLELFAEWSHPSFCLITSRIPPMDLFSYPAYRQHEVGGLSVPQGRSLLRSLGIAGEDKVLDRVVQLWEGHPLTLDLLGRLVSSKGEDAAAANRLSSSLLQGEGSEPLLRILRSYEELLSRSERRFLQVLSFFRLPVPPAAFEEVFRSPGLPRSGSAGAGRVRPLGFLSPLSSLEEPAFQRMVQGLAARHLVQCRPGENGAETYSLHALVRAYYLANPLEKKTDFKELHRLIAGYYTTRAKPPSEPPRLDDYLPWMEALHHYVQAGDFDLATEIFRTRLEESEKEESQRFALTRQIGAYDTLLIVLQEFFPEGDFTRDCLIPPALKPAEILRETAFTLMTVGRSREALTLYAALIDQAVRTKSWRQASLANQDLCRLQAISGRLAAAEKCAGKALQHAHRDRRNRRGGSVRNALVLRGWIRQLRGNLDQATEDFRAAEDAAMSLNSASQGLKSLRGALVADHLRGLGENVRARQIAAESLRRSEGLRHPYSLSRFHRILGELDAEEGNLASAREHHDAAVRFARSTSDRVTLTEALLSRGRLSVLDGRFDTARADLDEALSQAQESGYRLFEIRGRLAMAELHRALSHPDAARTEAQAALDASLDIGYPAGQEAAEILLRPLRAEKEVLHEKPDTVSPGGRRFPDGGSGRSDRRRPGGPSLPDGRHPGGGPVPRKGDRKDQAGGRGGPFAAPEPGGQAR